MAGMDRSGHVDTSAAEKELLRRMSGGDHDALDGLLESTYEQTWRALYRLTGDRDAAADLTQDTYRKAWQSLDTFDGRSRFSTWLYRIAYTTFLNSLRRPRLVEPLTEYAERTAESPDTAADVQLLAHERERRTHAAVMELPDDLRFVVTAHYWGGLAISEIARATGITSMGVRKRLRRAQELLARALGDLR